MTIDEALKIIDVNGYGYTEDVAQEAHDLIKPELEHRIKKPPIPTEGATMFGEARCPTCGNLVYRTEDACDKCGQLLDWLEVEP